MPPPPHNAKTGRKSGPKTGSRPDPKGGPKSGAKDASKPHSKAGPKRDADAGSKPYAKANARRGGDADSKLYSKAEAKRGDTSAKPHGKANTRRGADAGSKPFGKPDARRGAEAGSKPFGKSDARRGAEGGSKPFGRPDTRRGAEAGSKPFGRPDARRGADAGSKPFGKPDSRRGAEAGPKPFGKPDARRGADTGAKPFGRPEARRGADAGPKPYPRAEPKRSSSTGPKPFAKAAPSANPNAIPATDAQADPKTGQRIAKLLARAGIASRREIERMIEEGRIELNGTPLDTPATILTSLNGITVDGTPVQAAAPTRLFRYHKPAGLLTAERDFTGRPTIYDKLPEDLPRVIPVGRLDLNTEGLLLLTTDGELKRQLELPRSGVVRSYRARAYGHVSQAQLEDLIEGVEIEGVRYGSIDANLERRTGANVWVEMKLTEGKNREVRRVLEHLGLQVSRLIRTSYGTLSLGDLPSGAVDEVLQHDLVAFRKGLK